MPDDPGFQTEDLRHLIATLEEQQIKLGLDFSAQLTELRQRLEALLAGGQNSLNLSADGDVQVGGDVVGRDNVTTHLENAGSGAVVAHGGVGAGAGGVAVGDKVDGNVTVIGTQIVQQTLSPKALSLSEALRHYLNNIIHTHQHLHLQGIRAGSQPLSIDLEKVYVSLKAIEKHAAPAQRADETAEDAPGLRETMGHDLTVAAALKRYQRLVVIGDPGCGKTTLLAYLALTYARTFRDGAFLVRERLQLDESDSLPVLLPLRDFGRHLNGKHPDAGLDGPALLLDYLREYYAAQSIRLPEDFFSHYLDKGHAVILLDGMDEVAETKLRQRVARVVEKFAVRYPDNRFVVTSRMVGYNGAARIGAEFGLAKVREFNPEEVRRFVHDWTRAVEVTLAGNESKTVLLLAATREQGLIWAIENNPRLADLAVNPLLLTVIALVYRYRAQLYGRRSELYEEAVEVLLGLWDEAKGLDVEMLVGGRRLDAGDRRSLLEPVAFWMHKQKQREIELDELRPLLLPLFAGLAADNALVAGKAVDAFLRLINERSGLLVERRVGVYGFAHLTFQEYLAARALAGREDALAYTLSHLADPWWREVILLEAGYLSTQGRARVSKLIQTIMQADPRTEPEPCHHLLLAVECLFDVGVARVEGDVLGEVKRRLQVEADRHVPEKAEKDEQRAAMLRKVAAMNALSRIEGGLATTTGKFWKAPWGEPEWVRVPAGEFWMGSGKYDKEAYDDEKPLHRVFVPGFEIAPAPVTNTQYALFVSDTKAKPPEYWRGGEPPPGMENHPVVNVSWREAMAYCRWLSEKIGRTVRLPSEAEWEKAARGDQDQRRYPWGDEWDELRCNAGELGMGKTSPVGLFLNGASPYSVLDMSGNVFEWTESKFRNYPYEAGDGPEDLQGDASRMLRGGSSRRSCEGVRCACRYINHLDLRYGDLGFRVCVVR